MYKFTNEYVPNCVGCDCYTAFYEGNVDTKLIRRDGTLAPIKEWDLETDYNYPIDYIKDDPFGSIINDNMIEIVIVTKIAKTPDELKRLKNAIINAKHVNIRLIIPQSNYMPTIRSNIDNELYDSNQDEMN